jgi:hypothetical protein
VEPEADELLDDVSDSPDEPVAVVALVVAEPSVLADAVVEPLALSAMFAPSPTNAVRLSAAAAARERAAACRRRVGARPARACGPGTIGPGGGRSGRGGVCRFSITSLLRFEREPDRLQRNWSRALNGP